MVLVNIGLPDMCSLELIRIVDKVFQLPAIMICDYYDERLMMEGSMCGAAGAFIKPLSFDDIKCLSQFPAIKKCDMIMLKQVKTRNGVGPSNRFPGCDAQRFEHTVHCSKKRRIDEAGRVDVRNVGQSSVFMRPQDILYKIPVGIPIPQYSLAKAMLAVGAHRIYAPGIACECIGSEFIERRSQLFRAYLRQRLDSMNISAFAPNWPNVVAQPMNDFENADEIYNENYDNDEDETDDENNNEDENGDGDGDDDDDDDSDDYDDDDEDCDEDESFLAKYLENPYSREQLRMVVKVATLKWHGRPRALFEIPLPPPPPPSEEQPVLLSVSLAREIERIIHVNMASFRLPKASEQVRDNLATWVASTGPAGSSVLPPGGEEVDPELIDIGDVFDAIQALSDGTF